MKELLKKILKSEVVVYVIVGVFTTAVDYAVFALINELLKKGGMSVTRSSSIATAAAWFAAVIFAYFANKTIVFHSRDYRPLRVLREMTAFFAARIISGLAVFLFMWISVDRFGMNEYIAKVMTSIFNLVFNYVASKLIIFKKK